MNIDLDKIRVWEQYKRSDIVKQYFKLLKEYIDENYKQLFYRYDSEGNIVIGDYMKELTITDSVSEYLYYYIENIYGLIRPTFVSSVFYDSGLLYDVGFKYDSTGDTEPITLDILRKLFKFIYGLQYDHFSLPILVEMLADFCECPPTQIRVEKDPDVLLSYTVYIPPTPYALSFYNLYGGYRQIFNLPLGVSLELVLDGGITK